MTRHFADWLKVYVAHNSIGETPTAFNFWTGVSTIAGALRRRVWIDELSFKWWANFYIVLVGPAGLVQKSTSISPGMKMLSKVEGVKFGPNSITWQALIKALSDSQQEDLFILPDGTRDIRTDSPITVAVSEMGTFFKMEDHVMMDVLTDLWDSKDGPWTHTTLMSGDTIIQNPWINVIAGTTPTWLKTHFPEHMIGGGLASRMIFVFAENKRQLVAYPSQQVKASNFATEEKYLIEDLQHIALLKGQYVLSREAREWGTAWYEAHWTGPRPTHLASERYGGYISRKQAHIHKLAMILSAAKKDELVIEKEELQAALQLIESVEPSMLRVFESIGQVDEARKVDALVHLLYSYDALTSDELWKLVMNVMTSKDFSSALLAAVKSGKLKLVTKNGQRAVALNPLMRKDSHHDQQ